jgi:Patatin-like phospholipase
VNESGVRTVHLPRTDNGILGASFPIGSDSSSAFSSSSQFSSLRTSPERREPGLKILCLDGGGVRGLSICLILRELLNRLIALGVPKDTPPCEIFDLVCGTSTGGLIALLLGPLKMTVPEVMKIYKHGSKRVFNTIFLATVLRKIVNGTKLSTKTLNKVIREVIWDATGDMLVRMNSGHPNDCKVWVSKTSSPPVECGVDISVDLSLLLITTR